MPQADYQLENINFSAFRLELNAILQAGQTLNSGTTEPTVKFPNQWWVDLQNGLLKQRNVANTAWNTKARLDVDWFGITAADINALAKTSNLSDLSSIATARTNLGLVDSATNLVLNGNFEINQQEITSYPFGTGVSHLDQWDFFLAGGSGGTVATGAITQQSFVAGQTAVPGNPRKYLRVNNTTQGSSLGADSYHILSQRLENIYNFSSETLYLSFWARSTISSKKLVFELEQNFGVGASAAVFGAVNTYTLSSSWQQYTAVITVPSINGKTIVEGSSFLGLNFWLQSGSTYTSRLGQTVAWQGTGDVEIANVQLTRSSFVAPIATRTLAEELQLCQRYFEKISVSFEAYGVTNSFYRFHIPYKVTKRVTPTLSNLVFSSPSTTFQDYILSTLNNNSIRVKATTTGAFVFDATILVNARL